MGEVRRLGLEESFGVKLGVEKILPRGESYILKPALSVVPYSLSRLLISTGPKLRVQIERTGTLDFVQSK